MRGCSRFSSAVFAGAWVATLIGASAGRAADYQPPRPADDVVETTYEWRDEARRRTVPVKIYSPKNGDGPIPVVLFSHGLGGSRDGYAYLGRHWAGCGYASVHLQHPGSDESVWKDKPPAERSQALQKAGADLNNALQRPGDVRFVVDMLERWQADPSGAPASAPSPELLRRLDLKAIGMAGHSFGAHTTMAIAGQTLGAGPLAARLLGADGRARLSDERIKAAVQMSAPAPSLRRDLDAAYGSIKIPVFHLTGTADYVPLFPQTTAADRRIPYDRMSAAETCLVVFQDGDHMIFSGRERTATAEKRAQDAEFQRLICAGTTAFWDAYLRRNDAARRWLLGDGYRRLLGELGKFEAKAPGGGPVDPVAR